MITNNFSYNFKSNYSADRQKHSNFQPYFCFKTFLSQINNHQNKPDIFEHINIKSDCINDNVNFKGKVRKSDKVLVSDEKAQEFFDIFPCRNKDINDVKKLFSNNTDLLNSDVKEIKANFDRVVETFRNNGRLSKWAYTKACYKEPSLFTLNSDVVISNVNGVFEHFKNHGLKLENYLEVCSYFPKLYITKPERTIKNIEDTYDKLKKEITLRDYLLLCINQPNLFFYDPDDIANKVNAYKFSKKANKKPFNIQNCDYSVSLEAIYLALAFPSEYKNGYKGVTEKIITYYKSHPDKYIELKLPVVAGYEECKEFLTEFSINNIGRNIFGKPAITEVTAVSSCVSEDNIEKMLEKSDTYLHELDLNSKSSENKDTILPIEDEHSDQQSPDADETEISEEDYEKYFSSKKYKTKLASDLRIEGYSYENIGKELGLSKEYASVLVKSHCAKILKDCGALEPKYTEQAQKIIDITGMKRNVDKVVELIIENPTLLNADIDEFKEKFEKTLNLFSPYNLKKEQFAEVCYRQPLLLFSTPEKIFGHFNEICNRFKDNGLDMGKYVQAAVENPRLFSQSSKTIISRITQVCEEFKDEFKKAGLTDTDFIKICLAEPILFALTSQTISNNINGFCNGLKEQGINIDKSQYLKACFVFPPLLELKPETIIRNIDGLCQKLEELGVTLDKEKYIKNCLLNPTLFCLKPETIVRNVYTVYNFYKSYGLTFNEYIKCCQRAPSLFFQKPETIINHTNKVYNYFKRYGLKMDRYIYACKAVPRLFGQDHKTIINNVKTVYDYYKDIGVTPEDYIQRCIKCPTLFSSKPDTIIKKINAYFYIKGKDAKFTTSYCNNSLEYIYMSMIVLNQFKELLPQYKVRGNIYPRMKQTIIDYFNADESRKMHLKIPAGEGAQLCMETLNKFSTDNIKSGRNIFTYELI